VEEEGRLRLEDLPGGPRGMELLPVSADAAIALGMEDLGTLLRLERDPAGRPVRLRWQRLDGTAVEAGRGGE
jgi:hypothetical protein